jgi:hypothetical protein
MADPLARAPLNAYLRRQVILDVALRKVLRAAIKSLDSEIARLAASRSIGNQVRASQLRLTREMMAVWRDVGDVIEQNILGSAEDIAKVQQAFDKSMMKKLGAKMDQAFARSLLAQAQAGLDSYISRSHNHMTLSERVYRNGRRSVTAVEAIINEALLTGRSATEIARMVRSYINPRTPGGLSYAAMRLGRTELNNAFHETSRRLAIDDPFVQAVKWNLSGSHPRPDICNDYASRVTWSGGNPGEYKPSEVPNKPHPQCLCYVTTVPIAEETFLRNLKAGKYDNMADAA